MNVPLYRIWFAASPTTMALSGASIMRRFNNEPLSPDYCGYGNIAGNLANIPKVAAGGHWISRRFVAMSLLPHRGKHSSDMNSMSAEIPFLLSLTLRMSVSAAFVVTASMVTENSGPVIGALIATLPLSAGPAYVFLALDHNATFIAEGAQAGLATNAVTMAFCLTYVALAQRSNAIISVGGALVVWIALAALEGLVTWTLFGGALANAVAFAICIPLFRRFQHVAKVPLVAHYWYDIPLRATMVAVLVAIVVASSHWVGPFVSGAIALFPTVLFSMMLILHARIGGRTTAAMIANSGWAMMGFGVAIAVLQVAAVPLGSALALSLALTTCIVWNLALWWLGRKR